MGIAGLYPELGTGARVSLAKISADHLGSTGRRLRIAVDASIWAFQVQSGKGGNSPALRTLYYRLIRLLHLNITPLFVFDGPHRPSFKRNHKTNTHLTPSFTRSTKALLKHFGFPYHDAPGEAEAECANLQQRGLVDAVLSEDVDTLMFGCGVTMRNWAAEGAKCKTPTHVTVYERACVERESGLTPNGMILVALMRGGDYLPEGVPKCGIKTAVEVAKAGFGEQLCALSVDDGAGLSEWRRRLQRELETNEHGWFKRKNKSIRIPDGFPDKTVLGHYTNPVVTSLEKVERLKEKLCWSGKIDIAGLRESARWAFEWRGKLGAAKFIRCLAPALLSWKLCSATGDAREIVLGFHGHREHSSTGECKELRISFVPGNVVVVNMVAEVDDEVDAEPDEEEEFAPGADEVVKSKDYDPFAVERMWVLEVFARQGVPDMVEEYQNLGPKTKKKPATTRELRQRVKGKGTDDVGAMLERLDISSPDSENIGLSGAGIRDSEGISREASVDITILAERFGERLVLGDRPQELPPPPQIQNPSVSLESEPKTQIKAKTPKPRSCRTRRPREVQGDTGKWTATPKPSKTLGRSPPRGRRYSALGIYGAPLSPQGDVPPPPNPPTHPPIDFTLQSPIPIPPTPTLLEIISIPSSPEPFLHPPQSSPSRQSRPPLTPLQGPGRETPKKAGPPTCLVVDISEPESNPGPLLPQILGPSTTPKRIPHKSQFPRSLPARTAPPPPVIPAPAEERDVSVVKGRTTKKVVLRESLEGCWEFADGACGRNRNGWEQVEVVDLTEN